MAKHKSKLERFRDICEAVFFSDERGIKPVPYQIAKEIGYPQSHTTSYMNELAKKRILIKTRNGMYHLLKFRSLDDLENADSKLQLSKYYSLEIFDKLRKDLGIEEPEQQQKESIFKRKKVVLGPEIDEERDSLDEEISHILDVIDDFPLSFFVISKKDLLKWIEKEIIKLKKAETKQELAHIKFDIDLIVKLLEDSAKVVK
ncbi:MAG: hypothetical protein JSW73_03930 [Candidatus Woesearchaeota archaeon]|nr:MAG: hypothetical protein JSW73_03930 [Candidatus Woesearchaeota archaeon]